MKKMIIRFESLDESLDRVRKTLKSKKADLQARNEIFFDSLASYRSFFSAQRLEILSVIANKRPESIYQLAQLVDRDFASVLRDCERLESLGFIVLDKDEESPRARKAPKLPFPYSEIVVELPNGPIAFNFKLVV